MLEKVERKGIKKLFQFSSVLEPEIKEKAGCSIPNEQDKELLDYIWSDKNNKIYTKNIYHYHIQVKS